MDKLLQPDFGLMILTIVTFVALGAILKFSAWGSILGGIKSREEKIRGDIGRAEKAQADAESLRQRYEVQLAEAQKTIQDLVSKARQDGERTRAELIATAKSESEKILEKGRKDLAGETDKLKEQLRSEVAGLSVSIAEKILKRSVDAKVQDDVLKESLKSLTGASS